MWGMMALIYREEGGLRALYRGIVPTAVGVAPYVVSLLFLQGFRECSLGAVC